MGLLTSLLRANPENPTTPLSYPADWLLKLMGGGKSASGITVTRSNALQHSVVYACTRVISETLASVPLKVFERLAPRGRRPAREHPAWSLLTVQPNPWMSAFTWEEAMLRHAILTGNGYSWIQRDGSGTEVGFWLLRPEQVEPKVQDGVLFYRVRPVGQAGAVVYFADEILHVAGPGWDGIKGQSVLTHASESIGTGLAQQDHEGRFYANSATAGMVLEHPSKLGDRAFARLKQEIEAEHGGLDRAWRTMILEEGMKANQVQMPHRDAQFIEGRKFGIPDVARFFRMQLHKIQEMDKATFSNIEHQAIEHVVDTLTPWGRRVENELDRKLFSGTEHFSRHQFDALLRGDRQARSEAYSIGRQWGWLSANDVLELEDENPIGPQGDLYMVPLNMVPAESLVGAPPPDRNEMKRYRPIFADLMGRAVRKEVRDLRRHIAAHWPDLKALEAALVEHYVQHARWFAHLLEAPLNSLAGAPNPGLAQKVAREESDRSMQILTDLMAGPAATLRERFDAGIMAMTETIEQRAEALLARTLGHLSEDQ